MKEVDEKIYSVLTTDGQDTTSGRLGNLIGKNSATPYGIYLAFPVEEVTLPYLVYNDLLSLQDNSFNRDNTMMDLVREFVAVDSDKTKIYNILDRVFQLFDRQVLTGLTNDRILKSYREWSSELFYDEHLQSFKKKDRYIFKAYRKPRYS